MKNERKMMEVKLKNLSTLSIFALCFFVPIAAVTALLFVCVVIVLAVPVVIFFWLWGRVKWVFNIDGERDFARHMKAAIKGFSKRKSK